MQKIIKKFSGKHNTTNSLATLFSTHSQCLVQRKVSGASRLDMMCVGITIAVAFLWSSPLTPDIN